MSPGKPPMNLPLVVLHCLLLFTNILAELILQPFCHFTYITAHSSTLPSLYLCHSSFTNLSVASPISQLILQPFFCFSYVTGSSFTSLGKPSMNLPLVVLHCLLLFTNILAELILQPFCHFTYITAHSSTLPSLYLRHISFSNLSVASPISQLILQPFFRFSYITGSSLKSPGEPSTNLPLVVLHCLLLFTNILAELILQPFHRFTYVTAHSPTLPLLHLRHSSFSNPSFASPTSLALHLRHLASRPWFTHS